MTPAPSVVVADEQDDHPVDADRVERLAAAVLDAEGVGGAAELSVLFVDEARIAALAGRYLGHDGATDVLSFPIDGEDWADPAGAAGDVPRLLGDVVVCPSVAARNAATHAGSYDDELALLVVHGILHLLGMDHAEPAERDAMQQRERELLARFHGPLAGDPWAAGSGG